MTCQGRCRACNKCYFHDEAEDASGDAPHTCCRTPEQVRCILKPGHRVLVFPDMGMGRESWEKLGRPWQTASLGMWSAESIEEVETILRQVLGQL